jgi:hypothetical protein
MMVAILTQEQKDLLIGQKYNEESFFNPVQDGAGNWIISDEEIQYNIYPQFDWIKTLPMIEYIPV